MAYDPKTGEYKPDDTSVSNRMTGLLDKNNDYMKQAETQGLKAANRRGLLNSSMAVGAAQESRVAAALPIAQQEAAQAHQSNQTGRQLQVSDIQQQRGITSQEQMQQRDITSREGMQQTDIQAQQDRLAQELGSRERMQQAQLLAEREMQGERLTAAEQQQVRELEAAQTRLDQQLAQDRELAGLDRDLRERLQSMDLASGDLRAAATLAQGYEAAYSNTVAGIMSNPEIPATERQRYLDHAARVRDSNLSLLEQMFNVDLNWTPIPGSGGRNPDRDTMGGGAGNVNRYGDTMPQAV